MMTDWWMKALCRETGINDDLWFGRRNRVEGEAISMCRKCPVQIECLADALHEESQVGDKHLVYGIRGGMLASQRSKLLRLWTRHKTSA